MNDREPLERSIFAEALEISDPSERAAYLEKACGNDADLRREIVELLQADSSAGQFLSDNLTEPPRAALQELAEASPPSGAPSVVTITEKPGDRIGSYELIGKIGEGGCGVVYEAQQETPVRRRVAIKIIKLGMDTKAVVARLEAERQALALMDHANIAKVFDAGVTETGRSFFVMELVRGVWITDYCDQQNLPIRRRLELFIRVCHAVQHAHQKGIIHRDLKPSNILITVLDGEPAPKVIDFGIAKATEGRLTDQTLFTAFEQFLGTPAYMSPEQAAMTSQDIDTRSDIYSLGVLLYELLTGTTPFDTRTLLALGVDELRRIIREKEPPKPSTRLSKGLASPDSAPGARGREHEAVKSRDTPSPISVMWAGKGQARQVQGDLDSIVMKCLEKDRARRYATANGLAEDVRRHLNNEPVVARPPSRLYGFQKTLRRHRVGFAFGAGLVTVLTAGVVATSLEAVRAKKAEAEQAQSRWQIKAESYTSDISLAKQAWDEGDLRSAEQRLESYIPKPGEREDLRGFEWRYLWKLFQEESSKPIPITNDPVQLLVSSPAHSFVVAGCEKTIRLLDPATGNELGRFPHAALEVTNVAYAIALASQATNLLAVHRADGVVTLWDLGHKTVRSSFQAITTNFAARPFFEGDKFMALSPDGRFLAFGGPGTRRSELGMWDISATPHAPAKRVWDIEVTNGVMSLAFTIDGRTLVSAETFRGSRIRTWDVRTGGEGEAFPKTAGGNINALAVSPDGSLVAHAGLEARIHVLDFARREERFALDGHSGGVRSLAFSSDSHRLISGGSDGTVRIWDIPSRKVVGLGRDRSSLTIASVAFAPDGNSIFSANEEGIRIWNADLRTPETVIETRQEWGWLEFSPDGQWLVTSPGNNSDGSADAPAARVWDVASRQQKCYLAYKNRHPLPMAFSPVGHLFALSDLEKEGVVGLWDTATWNTAISPVKPFAYLTNGFEAGSLCFSPDGKILAAAGLDFVSENPSGATNRLAFWDVRSRQKLNLLPQAGVGSTERAAAASVAFSSDGRLVAVGHRDGRVRLWNFRQERLLWETNADDNVSFSGAVVRFSKDNRWLVSFLEGGNSLALFDLSDLKRVRAVSIIHPAYIWSASFTPDNKSLVTGDNDGLFRFRNLQTPLQVALTLRHSYGPGEFLAFSPDGNLLATKDGKGLVRFWKAPSLEEIDRDNRPHQ